MYNNTKMDKLSSGNKLNLNSKEKSENFIGFHETVETKKSENLVLNTEFIIYLA